MAIRIEDTISACFRPETCAAIKKNTLPIPKVPLNDIEPILRELTPLFLGETPYDPSNSFTTKCIKSTKATLMLLSYIHQKPRELLDFLPLASKIKDDVTAEIEHLEYRLVDLYHSEMDAIFLLMFEKEKLKVLKGESQEIPKEALIENRLADYKSKIEARTETFKKGKKIRYTKEDQTHMIEEYKEHLENLFKKLNSKDTQKTRDFEESIPALENLVEKFFSERCALAQTIDDLNFFLTSPLRT